MMTNLTLGMGEPPKQFGRYRILMKLGQGGMGVVYLAHDPELSRLVALKVPLDDGEADAAARFRRAARAAAALHHPNICPLYEAGVIDGTPFLTMAYIDGTTLAERLRLGRLPAAEAAALVRTLALALAEAHDCGVFHRDLKPSNVLINRRGEPILTDFGAASLGTPAYLPPERVRDGPDADGRAADVYSLGVILYELLTGRPPPTESDLFDRIVHDDPAPPSAHVPGLDPRFDAVCRTATAWDPTERYPDMAAFAAALAPFDAPARADHKEESWSLPLSMSGDVHPVTGGDKSSKPPARPSRWPWRLVAVGAAGMAVVIGVVYTATQIRYLQTPSIDPSIVAGSEDSAEAHLARTRSCFDANDMDGAIREAAEAASRRPALVSALVLRGRAEYRRGADEAADADFTEAYRRSEQPGADAPSSAQDYTDRAWCYLRIDRRDEALADCAAALRFDPGCTAAWLLSAQAWHDRGRRDEERQTYADAWNAVHPSSAEQYADLARIALALDRPEDALRCCEEALRRDLRSSDAFEARAQARLRVGDRDRAAADFRRAAALMNPRWARDYLERSVLRELAGDPDGALADAGRALELAPRLPAALRQRGAACRARKDHAAAVADCRAAAAGLTPRFAADYFDRAWLLNEIGDHGRAADDLEKALALGLRSGEVHRELAHARRNLKQYDRAAVHLDAARRLLPADALLSGERAALSLARGRPGEAVRAYSEVLAQAPDDALAYAGRGDAYVQMEEYESAVEDYTRALLRTASSDRATLADLYDRRGVALAQLGRYAEAAADYGRAIDNDPADPVLYRNRAAALLRAGDDEAAEADVRKAAELQAAPP